MAKNKGTVVQIMGPVLDIRFEEDQLPSLLNAIEVPNGDKTIIAEVAQHIGDNVPRCKTEINGICESSILKGAAFCL